MYNTHNVCGTAKPNFNFDTPKNTTESTMAHRIIFQLIITGTQAFGRAFTEAYKQAATVSKESAKQAAKNPSRAATAGGIDLGEAMKILNVTPGEITQEVIQKRYEYLFHINDKEKGGSFYIQSKVYRAMERIKAEIEAKEADIKPPHPET